MLPAMFDLSDQVHALIEDQTRTWNVLRDNRAAMAAAEIREMDFRRFVIKAQFNRQRLKLCSTPVDPHAIRNRDCFLCDANRPAEQASLSWKHGFKILCNPFPILPEHFTIVQTEHRPQRILPYVPIMLGLARDMDRYTIFYNGPQCGASAPDHMHFQAGTKGYMPIDTEHSRVARLLRESDGVRTFVSENYLRRFISFESNGNDGIVREFGKFHNRLSALQPQAQEPMMNVMCSYNGGTWRLIAFLRSKHRPGFYFLDEPQRMLTSPGSIDMGGIPVVPRAHDFARTTPQVIQQIYEEVSLPQELFEQVARASSP
jgi:hypothetical protein